MFSVQAMLFRLYVTFIIYTFWKDFFPAFALLTPPRSEDSAQVSIPPGSLPWLSKDSLCNFS